MKKIGILGGTFDPIHYGHLLMAELSAEQLKLDKVLIMPTGIPPHKINQEITEKKHRTEMVKLAVSKNEKFEISYIDSENTKPCYTVNTLTELEKIYKDAEFFYIIGTDSLVNLDKWYHYDELFSKTGFAVIKRNSETDSEIEKKAEFFSQKFNAKIYFVDMPVIELSSTEIRTRVKNGKSVKYMLPEAVEQYIRQNGLYN